MITASIIVVVGSISYIGLIVPNVVAMFKGDKIRGTLVDTALLELCLFWYVILSEELLLCRMSFRLNL